jgi:hypothetical protein
MGTNVFFNNFENSMEQRLIEDLIVESIKIYGQDMYYLPKTIVDYDSIYGEGKQAAQFDDALLVEFYIRNVEGFEGEGDFLSKFNLEIRDRVTLTIARKTFFDEVGSLKRLDRPQEGDIIYFPLNRKFFEIKFVEHEAIFYQLGALQTFDVVCELFEFSNEIFNTGIDIIDTYFKRQTLDMEQFAFANEDGGRLLTEDGATIISDSYNIQLQTTAENDDIEKEALVFLDFSEKDPFSEKGVF